MGKPIKLADLIELNADRGAELDVGDGGPPIYIPPRVNWPVTALEAQGYEAQIRGILDFGNPPPEQSDDPDAERVPSAADRYLMMAGGDVTTLLSALAHREGIEPGNSRASSRSSKSTAGRSTRTSKGSTGSTSAKNSDQDASDGDDSPGS